MQKTFLEAFVDFIKDEPLGFFLFIIMMLPALTVVFIVLYNKSYVKKNMDEFLILYYGEVDVSPRIKSNLGMTTFFFMITYFSQVTLNNVFKYTKNNPFPSKGANKKPYMLTPNAYMENIDKFKLTHKKWFFYNCFLHGFLYVFIIILFIIWLWLV